MRCVSALRCASAFSRWMAHKLHERFASRQRSGGAAAAAPAAAGDEGGGEGEREEEQEEEEEEATVEEEAVAMALLGSSRTGVCLRSGRS